MGKYIVKDLFVENIDMKKICTNCKQTGQETRDISLLIFSILDIFLGLVLVLNLDLLNLISLAGSLVLVIFGIYGIGYYFSNPNKCPICQSKNTMIPLDTPRAQQSSKKTTSQFPSLKHLI